MRALIVFGADVNITNKRHETPRHAATLVHKSRWREVLSALGFVGAAACDKSKNGCTLECSKPFQEEMTIGKKNNHVSKVYQGVLTIPFCYQKLDCSIETSNGIAHSIEKFPKKDVNPQTRPN